MSKTITLTDEQWEALQRGESITIEPPERGWNPRDSSFWVIHNHTGWRLPWIPYGPEDKVLELVDKLNPGEVEF